MKTKKETDHVLALFSRVLWYQKNRKQRSGNVFQANTIVTWFYTRIFRHLAPATRFVPRHKKVASKTRVQLLIKPQFLYRCYDFSR